MTQTEAKQRKTNYPKGHMLVTRECMKAICLENSSATKMLSVLMHRYDYSDYPAVNGLFTIVCTQADIVRDTCDEITEKTLHDVAGPFLQLLGFLDIEERIGGNRYTLHIGVIHEALRLYGECKGQLEKFLIDHLQLEKFLIDPKRVIQSEKSLINRKNFQLQLEKVRIANRESSNCRRGPKAKSQALSDGNSPNTENKRELQEINKEREEGDDTPTSSQPNVSLSHSSESLSISQETENILKGGVISPPPSVEGVSLSSNPSGGDTLNLAKEHASPPAQQAITAPPVPIVVHTDVTTLDVQQDSSDVQGYMNPPTREESSHVEPPDSDALSSLHYQTVMPNSTPMEEVGGITQEVLRWITDEHIPRARNPETVALQIADLVQGNVTSLEQLKSLRAFTQGEIDASNRANKTCYLGNMVKAADRWLQSQISPPSISPAGANDQIGMSREQAEQVIGDILACSKHYIIDPFSVDEARTRFTLGLRYGDNEADFYEILRFEDAPYVYGHPGVLEDCIRHGQALSVVA